MNIATNTPRWSEFKVALPIAFLVIILFIVLQKIGLIDLINSEKVTYGTAFFVGLVASLSTCTAMVGGIVLSMSATFAKDGSALKPQLMFHIGRVVSFFILGGIIGVLGATFTLSSTATFFISIVVAIVMLILGLNLLDVFPWAEKFQISMPDFIARRAHGLSKLNHSLTPLLVGIGTFFLPCGFTQSMQLYTLSTGSFLTGGLTMLAFALGTLPVLAVVSFGSLSIKDSPKKGVILKIAGLIVIAFGLFNIVTSFKAIGITPFPGKQNAESSVQMSTLNNVNIVDGVQIIDITVRGGYWPEKTVAQAGIPTVVRFNTKGTFDCSSSVRIPSLDISKILPSSGMTEIALGNPAPGALPATCGMGMYDFNIDFKE